MAREGIIERAILRIDLSDTARDLQSGWFFTSDGWILSAGHGFKPEQVGQQFRVTLLSGEWSGVAILRELADGKGQLPDYALLQVEQGTPSQGAYVPVRLRAVKGVAEAICVGAVAAIQGGRSVRLEGNINMSHPGRSGRSLLQFITPEFDRHGMSGAPILTRPKESKWAARTRWLMHEWEAVGIQVTQTEDETSRSVAFGQPLSQVHCFSSLLRRLVGRQANRDAFRRWPLFVLEDDFFGTISTAELGKRVVFVVREFINNSASKAVWNELQEKILSVEADLSDQIESVPWLHQDTVAPAVDLIDGELQPVGGLNAHLDNPVDIVPGNVPWVRLAIDLTARLPNLNLTPQQRESMSHVLAIRFPESETAWVSVPQNIPSVDAVFHLSNSSSPETADMVGNLVHDVLLDIAIFYGVRILPALFSGQEGAAAFSEAKVRFARENDLRPYGLVLPSGAIHYVPLSACARSGLDGTLSNPQLTRIWYSFICDYLLPAVERDDDGAVRAAAPLEVVRKLHEVAPKQSFSDARALEKIRQLSAKAGELCALAVVTSLPSRHSPLQRRALADKFGRKRAFRGLVCAFRFDDMGALFQFKRHIAVVFYRAE